MRDQAKQASQITRSEATVRGLDRIGVTTVPVGWILSSVGKACTIRNELRLPLSLDTRSAMQGTYPYYGPTGILDHLDAFRAEGEFALIGEDGDHFLDAEKKSQTVRVSGRFNVNNHAHLIANGSTCSVDWFFHFFRHRDISHSLTRQGAGRYKLTKRALEDLPVLLPPLPEQRKIAEILRTWDEAIDKLEALRAAKLRRLEALRDALLFKGLRVGEVRRNRPMRRIGEVTRELTARNGDGVLGRNLVMGVTNSRGIVPMREQTVGADIDRYKKLPPRAFAYNPMRINVGSISMNTSNRTVLVSPDYVVFACEEDSMEPDYLDHLRQTRWWLYQINSGGSGSVRQRTYYDDLAALHLPLPDLGEQRDIVKILNTAKADVAVSAELGEALTRQKRGLMQKLLTGEWRVNVETH
ncbi:restriction endonuclease subunit S [Aquabacter sp. L1I39]|uniref:restriction endonuclease subunit S n=1 Tax=Aquabacter sp. L1I39 TaxID=2820278 RepID=UPI001ADA1877|nr:restriction endonuclease subunit S [Aquabacter sp. L1I39]QTL05578.1 restriction endonuclease subunit S [Aquabacter sp. L1I39]